MSSSNRLRVAIRLRPPAPTEKDKSPISVPNQQTVVHHNISQERTYSFDRVYTATTTAEEGSQALIFHDIGPVLIRDLIDAVNVCVISYGQSGTGKSYTMLGQGPNPSEECGLVPRMCDTLFATLAESSKLPFLATVTTYKVQVSAMYIFNEKVYDAMPKKGQSRRTGSKPATTPRTEELRVREHPERGAYVDGLQECVATSAAEVADWYAAGDKARPSPRAHFIFQIKYTQLVEQPVHDAVPGMKFTREVNVITRRHSMVEFPTMESWDGQCPTLSEEQINAIFDSGPSPPSTQQVEPSAKTTLLPSVATPRPGSQVKTLHRPSNQNRGDCVRTLPSVATPRSGSENIMNRSNSQTRMDSVMKAHPQEKPLVISKANVELSHRSALMTLCDLASVDRSVYEIKPSRATLGDRTMSGKLNLSLSCLARVIGLLSEAKHKKGLLPFRDSTLTWVLKDMLAGNCKTLIIATISPDAKDEENTISTLMFAERARNVRTHYQRNVHNESSVTSILRELTDIYSELNFQRSEIRRLLAPYGIKDSEGSGATAKHVSTIRGVSLTADNDFFNGPCGLEPGNTIVKSDPGELSTLNDDVEVRIAENVKAIKDVLMPFFKAQKADPNCQESTAFAGTMHQLGLFRVNVLREVLPEEYEEVTKEYIRERTTAPLEVVHFQGPGGPNGPCGPGGPGGTGKDPLPAPERKRNSFSSLEGERAEPARETIDVNEAEVASPTRCLPGETDVEYRVRMKILNEEKVWNSILEAGDSEPQTALEARSVYLDKHNRGLIPPISKKQYTVHVCKQSYSTWDTEYIDTNFGNFSEEVLYRRHNTLSTACRVAEDGDVIEIHEGIWHDNITIMRDIEIKGVGKRQNIVVKGLNSNPSLTMNTPKGCVRNLTFHQNGGDSCVFIRGGCGELVGCEISASRAKAGVYISGRSANPWVHDNLIQDCTMHGYGVLVDKGARGIIEKNRITRCGSAGIVIEGSTTHPYVVGNNLVSGKGAGIAFGEGGCGLIENNTIEKNACGGVLLEGKGNPTLRGNTIKYNLGGGVIVTGPGTRGLLEENVISDNSDREVLVAREATTQLRRNTFIGGTRKGVSAPYGVVVTQQALCLLTENQFEDYEGFCVACQLEKSWAYLIANTFRLTSEENSGAVSIFNHGRSQIRYNSFYFSGAAAQKSDRWLVCATASGLAIRGNKVNDQAVVPPDAYMAPYKFEAMVAAEKGCSFLPLN